VNFLFAIRLSLDFYKVPISANNEKIILKFVALSITLARTGTILPVVRETTRIILESYRECAIDLLCIPKFKSCRLANFHERLNVLLHHGISKKKTIINTNILPSKLNYNYATSRARIKNRIFCTESFNQCTNWAKGDLHHIN